MRMVVDLSNLDASRWVNSTGQSGHAYHDNYTDQIDAWAANETYPWPFTPKATSEESTTELTLKPPSAP
jgi:penicillin amidase